MIFKKIIDPLLNPFSKPQWQAKNPQTRKKGIKELLEPGSPELADIALKDSDESVRICAINRISDLDVLQTIIMSDCSNEIKDATYNQYNQMLAGEKFPTPALEEREKIIRGCRNSRSLEYLAVNARETDLRKVAVKKIARDALLGNIALNDKNADIRLLAASQIGKKSTLERVSKLSRNKDKRVYKTARDKLNNIIEDEQRPRLLSQEVKDTIDKLEKLYKRNHLLIEKTTYENLVTRWTEIKNYADEVNCKRFDEIKQKIGNKIAQLEEQQQQQAVIIENLSEIISNLTAEANELLKERDNNNTLQIEEKQKVIGLYKQSWKEQIIQIHEPEKQQLNAQYVDILKLIEQSEEPKQEHSSHDLIENYLKQLKNLSQSENYLGEKLVNTLCDKFHAEYAKLDAQSAQSKENLQQFNHLSQRLTERLNQQKKAHNKLILYLQQQLEKIAEKITAGLTDEAQKLKAAYVKKIGQSSALSNSDKKRFLDQVKDSGSQLSQLTSWKNWANNRERENLCNKAEEVLGAIENSKDEIALVYEEYSDQIKTLRSQWKKLTGRSPDELWERFNNACNQAFEKFEPYFLQQAEQREKNLQLKQKIIEQLKTYVDFMQWPPAQTDEIQANVDWKQVQSILNQAQKEWNSIKQVERKQYKPLIKEFEHYNHVIETELKKVWNYNQALYHELIDKVYALQEIMEEDLNSAISQTKLLQNDWKQIGPVQHFQRKKLWRKFRKGCDIIFAKRDEKNTQKQKQNELRLMEKVGLCENLEALNQQELSIQDLKAAFGDISNLWNDLKGQAKSISQEANKRFHDATTQFNEKIDSLAAQQISEQIDLLKQKVALCADLEQLNCDNNLAEWQALPNLIDSNREKDIQKRYRQAQQLLQDSKLRETLISSSTQEKESLCLRLELATGHQSPEKDSQSRMELQIQKLSSAMSNQKDFEDDNSEKLLFLWCSLPTFEQHKSLEERFFKIIDK